jgi:tRNA-dihydrouridine synthase 3
LLYHHYLIQLHGRSRLQRYHRLANWDYILEASKSQDPTLPLVPIIGNGDILSFEDWKEHAHMVRAGIDCSPSELGITNCAMIARGALVKPWLPKEIKEDQHIDMPASERLEMLKRYW